MGDLSLIEFGVYGFIAYSSLLMLIISVIKTNVPNDTPLSIIRVIFLLPGIFCAGILSSSGVNITTENSNTSNIIKDLNNTDTWQETTTQTSKFVLINYVWIIVHFLIFITLCIYVIQQVLILLTKHPKEGVHD